MNDILLFTFKSLFLFAFQNCLLKVKCVILSNYVCMKAFKLMSSKESPDNFLIATQDGERARRAYKNYNELTSSKIIESMLTHFKKDDYCLFFADSFVMLPIPDKAIPLKVFPQVIVTVSASSSSDWNEIPRLMMYPLSSSHVGMASFVVEHQDDLYPNVTVNIKIENDDDENIQNNFERSFAKNKWEIIYQQISSSLKIQQNQIIIKISRKNERHIVFPFQYLIEGLGNLFNKENNEFLNDVRLYYCVGSEKMEEQTSKLRIRTSFVDGYAQRMNFFKSLPIEIVKRLIAFQNDLLNLSSNNIMNIMPITLNLLFKQYLLQPIDKSFISALKHVLSQSLVTLMMTFIASIFERYDFKLKSWNVFVSFVENLPSLTKFNIDFENEKEKSLSYITVSSISQYSNFVEKIVDYSYQFHNYFSKPHMFPQSECVLGTLILKTIVKVENIKYILILTTGFVYFCEFKTPPKDNL